MRSESMPVSFEERLRQKVATGQKRQGRATLYATAMAIEKRARLKSEINGNNGEGESSPAAIKSLEFQVFGDASLG